ncbi:MAG TPA: YXWGXW repeat-containing protein [Usitatibacter sp.]|nr:YXWGXW repeat-containing protein [Usitatibacter sp.]
MLKSKFLSPLVITLGFVALPALSEIRYVEVAAPPPAAVVEVTPVVPEGYVWTPGYWDYRDNSYAWVNGRSEPLRPGYHYVTPRWEENDGRWRIYQGQWVKNDEEHGGLRKRVRRDDD